MWTWLVNFLMGLLRWGIITYIAKPLVESAIIKPISEMLLGGSPVDAIEDTIADAIEDAIEDVIEDAIEADAGSVVNISAGINGVRHEVNR